ncbi:DUF6973 domain-containing protein [Brevibacillus brevis]|uniref:DUF6973 domain-containing protein n=1 Tax=Brevibacillus brevis TaxID=1393 RepID=UPI000D0EE562|nr:hypothetical protein [Brevibacillus brevis]PSJ67995.1 hypothetical protein C7J99_16345 [Brevibacillus brevis]RED35462.1 hypothetical protein DES34_101119 [Brevibacillus brevis]GEC87874.1 hypothetical protein BBR01nite_02050 [Brevibacillus brevis]VEF89428.1 Uncharacterised protein [Brevibacillus brevis]
MKNGDFDKIFSEIVNFRTNNPDASQDELNDKLLEITEKYSNNSNDQFSAKASGDDYDWPVPGTTLNDQEQEMYDSNPIYGIYALGAGKTAWDYTIAKFGRNGLGDRSDAFRHAAWSLILVSMTDDAWTRAWTDAHEYGAADYSKNNPHAKMDLHNNGEGRYKATKEGLSGYTDPADVVYIIDDYIDEVYFSGDLKRLVKKSNNSEKITGKEPWDQLKVTYFTGDESDFK